MKNVLLLLLVCLLANISMAQNVYNSSGRKTPIKHKKSTGFNRDKVVVGGDFRLSAGQGVSVGLAPILGYQLANNFFAGIRIGYSYDRNNAQFQGVLPSGKSNFVFSSNGYSAGLWTRYLIMKSFYLHAEAEYNSFKAWDYNYWDYSKGEFYNERFNAPSVLVGIGFRQPINDRVSFNTTFLLDVLNDPKGYYQYVGGFDLRFGVLVGF